MKQREGDSWIPADEYGRSLRGFDVNLLVAEIERSVHFQTEVLGAEVVYADPDFAVLRAQGGEWMLHADHTYRDHPLHGSLGPEVIRGIGVELRVHGCDPDLARTIHECGSSGAHGTDFACFVCSTGRRVGDQTVVAGLD